ncbi:unnamed protein product [Adineta ricciae]|uniref:Inositol hexakisphosphate and diphosphoinositol-pentakisphosphate kinase n=1 Tax=Adineta ricciae TaxID=249248 RepID=A0A814KEY9_ADIRI|nr:unnamed protein product [Adineta ricciae]
MNSSNATPLFNQTVDRNHWTWSLQTIIVLLTCGLITLATILGNGLVLLSIKFRLHTRSYSDYFIVSLCLADFFVGLFVMPPMALHTFQLKWPFHYRLCYMWMSIDFTCSTASFLTLASMALDRYYALTAPYFHLRNRSYSSVLIFIVSSWAIPFAIWPMSIFLGQHFSSSPPSCVHPANSYIIVVLCSFFYYIPLLFMLCCYSRIIVNIKNIEVMIKGTWGTIKYNPNDYGHGYTQNSDKHNLTSTSSQSTSSLRSLLLRYFQRNTTKHPLQNPTRSGNGSPYNIPVNLLNNRCNRLGTVSNYGFASNTLSPVPLYRSNRQATTATFTGQKRCLNDVIEEKRSKPDSTLNQEEELVRTRLSTRTSSLPAARCISYYHFPSSNISQTKILEDSPHTRFNSISNERSRSHSHSSNQSVGINGGVLTTDISEHSSSFDNTLDDDHRRLSRRHLPSHTTSTSFNSSRYSQRAVAQFMHERNKARLRRNQKASRMLGILLAVFLICWLPFIISYPIMLLYPKKFSVELECIIFWLGYVNSLLNPFLYVYRLKAKTRLRYQWSLRKTNSQTEDKIRWHQIDLQQAKIMSEYNADIRDDECCGDSINNDENDDIFDDLDNMNDSEEDRRLITVGICAQWKKIKAKPMEEILHRLEQFEFLRIIVFTETMIHEKSIEEWPFCHVLISFHSKGFPLAKTQEYARLHRPFLINDLDKQWCIMDRIKVHEILDDTGIPQPRYGVVRREKNEDGTWITLSNVIEQDDQIEIDGQIFHKPFVEKPVSAENHDVYIYFPSSAGGGSQRLFRKIGSRSSVYTSENSIRNDGSYIYEEFMPTDGTDVKVYTVGAEYAHAEARKSPGLDGKVERDEFGKEVRYPVILRADEKLIAMKICLAFKQTVCGFDLLRVEGKSFVCDVNGFSFVKNSTKYYDDCASILGHMIMRELAPTLSIPYPLAYQPEDPPYVPTAFGTRMELRCVIGVIRHGDRTPKQKMKMVVLHPLFFQLFEKYNGPKNGHLKLKHPGQLQEVLDIARTLLKELDDDGLTKLPNSSETRGKLVQLKQVLELYGHFSGINRKIQLKYLPKGPPKKSSSEDELDDIPSQPSLLLVVKWGGQLTQTGKNQAEALGKSFRKMYPGGQGAVGDRPDVGLLRLHSTFRHDLKIYASDEGRVQMTAAAFAKGLLALDGELAPILVQMVKSANTNGLLDNDVDSTKEQQKVKQTLHDLLAKDRDFNQEDYDKIAPTRSRSFTSSMDFIKNPVVICRKILEYIHEMTVLIRTHVFKGESTTLFHSETWDLCLRRWLKLEKDFYNIQKDKFNISKVPDIYDSIKYDLLHNKNKLQFPHADDLYVCSKALADIVVPQEYGMTIEEKLSIARGIVTPLLRKIRADLQCNLTGVLTHDEHVNKLDPSCSKGIQTPGRHVRTRLYFTSESHVHSLLTIIRYGGLLDTHADEQWKRSMSYLETVSELNYLTQIVIMLYEDSSEEMDSEKRFHVELHFSPGAYGCFDVPPDIDSVTSDVNTIRTVLPKSNREAAHSPPRDQTKALLIESTNATSSPKVINPVPTIITVDCASPPMTTEKTNPKMIKESHATKNYHRNSDGIIPSCSSEPTDYEEIHSTSVPRSSHYDNYLLKPKSLDNSESKLQHLTGQQSEPSPVFSSEIRCKSNTILGICPSKSHAQLSLLYNSELSRRNSGTLFYVWKSILTHNYYNTIHGGLSDKRILNYVPLTSIFSTRVISGAKSTPDLNKLLERKQAGLICPETVVLAPLETLNTNLNYKILDDFIGKMTGSTVKFLSTEPTAMLTLPPLPSDVAINRFSVESVDTNNGQYGNDKKGRVSFVKIPQYSINTINELPEKND